METYPSPEQITPDKYSKIVRTANREDVGLVISNNASGTSFGEQIATETGVEHVVLGNFPGWTRGVNTYFDMVTSNAERLFNGVKAYRGRQGTIANLEDRAQGMELQRNIAVTAAVIIAVIAALEFVMIRRR